MNSINVTSFNLGDTDTYPVTFINSSELEIISKNMELIINSNLNIKELIKRYQSSYLDDLLLNHKLSFENLELITCHDIFVKVFKYGGNLQGNKIKNSINDTSISEDLADSFGDFFTQLSTNVGNTLPCLMLDPEKFILYRINKKINNFWQDLDSYLSSYLVNTENIEKLDKIILKNEKYKWSYKNLFKNPILNKFLLEILTTIDGLLFVSLVYILISDIALTKMYHEERGEYNCLLNIIESGDNQLYKKDNLINMKKNWISSNCVNKNYDNIYLLQTNSDNLIYLPNNKIKIIENNQDLNLILERYKDILRLRFIKINSISVVLFTIKISDYLLLDRIFQDISELHNKGYNIVIGLSFLGDKNIVPLLKNYQYSFENNEITNYNHRSWLCPYFSKIKNNNKNITDFILTLGSNFLIDRYDVQNKDIIIKLGSQVKVKYGNKTIKGIVYEYNHNDTYAIKYKNGTIDYDIPIKLITGIERNNLVEIDRDIMKNNNPSNHYPVKIKISYM